MPKKTNAFTSATVLSLTVGLFLLLSGILDLIDRNSVMGQVSSLFADKTTGIVLVVAAILKIVSGAVLFVGPLGLLTRGIRSLGFWLVVGFWALFTLWVAVLGLGAFRGDATAILRWFETLALNVAILAALWHLKPNSP